MTLKRNQQTVLAVLADVDREMSGLEIADVIGSLGRSSVYAALSALQRDGFASARWDMTESHPRKMMRITRAGVAALADVERAARETAERARSLRTRRNTT